MLSGEINRSINLVGIKATKGAKAAIEAVKGIGNSRVAAFTSAVGSAGTIAAGDQLKSVFPECKIVALEPYECSTLMDGGRGQHRIEGIGDKMCTLIHNVDNTDFITLIKDDDTIRGLKVIHDGLDVLIENGVKKETALEMKEYFGPSGLCNIIGAIKMAKYLKLGPNDNVVTVATDGFDRYESVLEDLEMRYLETEGNVLKRWFKDIFRKIDVEDVVDFRSAERKEQLFTQKENDWLKFGYSQEYLDSMKTQEFWNNEYEKHTHYSELIKKQREE